MRMRVKDTLNRGIRAMILPVIVKTETSLSFRSESFNSNERKGSNRRQQKLRNKSVVNFDKDMLSKIVGRAYNMLTFLGFINQNKIYR